MQQKVVRVSKFSEHRHKTHDVKEQGKKNPDRDKPQRKKIKLVTTVGMVWLLFQAKSQLDESPKTALFKLIQHKTQLNTMVAISSLNCLLQFTFNL